MCKFIFVIFSSKNEKISSWLNITYLSATIKKLKYIEVECLIYPLDDIEKAIDEVYKKS
jgi:hypothetical protein